MSNLIPFYLKEEPNCEGRWLEELWDWDNEAWEEEHSFVQWLFPTKEESIFNPEAPLLDDDIIRNWRRDKLLQHNLRFSYERWLLFCGICRSESGIYIVNHNNDVWARKNHNWWRATRVVKSLKILGLNKEANEFYTLLLDPKIPADEETLNYWHNAIKE